MVDNVSELVGRQGQVEADGNAACVIQGQIGDHMFRAVGDHDAARISPLNT